VGTHANLRLFFKFYQVQLGFALWFTIIFLLMNFIYFLLADTFIGNFVLSSLTARPSAAIIQFIGSGEGMVIEGNRLTSQYGSLLISHGCEGAQSILILSSAILAFNTSRRRKLTGLLYGVSFLYVVNLLRIVGMYYVIEYGRSALDVAHLYIGQTVVIMIMFVFFIFWVRKNIDGQERTD
jgi:exosortase family protein XrtM